MVRQYIGARYVPKFSDKNGGVWSNIYSYEALEIVKNGNDFYTSRRSVPEGIDISNTTYWVKTGDYNGAIIHVEGMIHIKTPSDYGAAGDGSTDDSSSFQACVDENSVILIEKPYLIHDISIDHDILFIGAGGEIKSTPDSTSEPLKNVFTIDEANVDFENVKFSGKKYNGTEITTRDSYIYANDCDRIIFNGCTFTGMGWRYANIDTEVWNYKSLICTAVDVTQFIFTNNIIDNIGGDEILMITPYAKSETSVIFRDNLFKDISTGASINLFGTSVTIKDNTFNSFTYNGSIFNVSAFNFEFNDNKFYDCTVRNVVDANEGAIFMAEKAHICGNEYHGGALSVFAQIIGSHLVMTDNLIDGASLVQHELTANLSTKVCTALQNSIERKKCTSVIKNNLLHVLGSLTGGALIRTMSVGVSATPVYSKTALGVQESVIIDDNTVIIDQYQNVGNAGLFVISNTVKNVSVSGNAISNPNIDSLAGSAKYLVESDPRDTAGVGGQIAIENNVITDVNAAIGSIYLLGTVGQGAATDTLLANGNYAGTLPINIQSGLQTSVVKYTIDT